MTDHLIELVRSAALHAEPILAACTTNRLRDPTPCPDLDVGLLAGHLIGSLVGFADVADGKEIRFDADPDFSKLTRALNIDSAIPESLATAALNSALLWVDDSTRVPVLFGPEVPVPASAPVTDRLVGFLGRDPSWVSPKLSTVKRTEEEKV